MYPFCLKAQAGKAEADMNIERKESYVLLPLTSRTNH
jgi:hypothetical protein